MINVANVVKDLNRLRLAAERVALWKPKKGAKLGPEMRELADDIKNLRTTIDKITKESVIKEPADVRI